MHFLHTVGWAVLLGSFGAAVAMPEAEPGTLEARACYCVGALRMQLSWQLQPLWLSWQLRQTSGPMWLSGGSRFCVGGMNMLG